MRFAVVLMFWITAMLPPVPQGSAADSRDETAVRNVVSTYVDARDRRDAAAVRGLFTEDADQLTSSGEWRRGREDVVKGSLGSSAANRGTRTISIESVRFPAEGIALADGAYTIADGSATRQMRTSFVMVRADGAWRITAIRNMLPASPAR